MTQSSESTYAIGNWKASSAFPNADNANVINFATEVGHFFTSINKSSKRDDSHPLDKIECAQC